MSNRYLQVRVLDHSVTVNQNANILNKRSELQTRKYILDRVGLTTFQIDNVHLVNKWNCKLNYFGLFWETDWVISTNAVSL